jgi:hypothetical protein
MDANFIVVALTTWTLVSVATAIVAAGALSLRERTAGDGHEAPDFQPAWFEEGLPADR